MTDNECKAQMAVNTLDPLLLQSDILFKLSVGTLNDLYEYTKNRAFDARDGKLYRLQDTLAEICTTIAAITTAKALRKK